jgi:alkylation response protein AidB-like acyl-CoA dehydrogenase
MTLLLARHIDPSNPQTTDFNSSKGLSLFYAKMRDPESSNGLNGIRLHRLKNKLGTRALPTAELELDGMKATLVGPMGRGVAQMATMLNLSRLWVHFFFRHDSFTCLLEHSLRSCSHCCVWSSGYVARALQLASDWSTRRHAFGKPLYRHPLHLHSLARLNLSYRAILHLTFNSVGLVGKTEVDALRDGKESEDDRWMLRLLTPVAKAFVSLESVKVVQGCMEAIGGQGYMEDGTGMGRLYRDVLVVGFESEVTRPTETGSADAFNNPQNTLWEGTVNALSHDLLRVFHQTQGRAIDLLRSSIHARLARAAAVPELKAACAAVVGSTDEITRFAESMMKTASGDGKEVGIESERLLKEMTLGIGRTISGSLMVGLARSFVRRRVVEAKKCESCPQIEHALNTRDTADLVAAQRWNRTSNLIGAFKDELELSQQAFFAVQGLDGDRSGGKQWLVGDARVDSGDGLLGLEMLVSAPAEVRA